MTSPTTLPAWLSYLESLHPKTIELGLARVATVKNRMQLQPDFPVIIVGGTNGKGSVCAMLEAMYRAAGFRVGCYTSPHLLRYNERVRIDQWEVSDDELCASFAAIEAARGETALTYFEFGTLAAMQLFQARQVEVAILEVGLGGRLDAVNVFDADCAIVTSVDIDHTDYLGDTREAIGFEKAGIFRPGKVAICADSAPPQSLLEHAAHIGAPLWCIGQEFNYRVVSTTEAQVSSPLAIAKAEPSPLPPQQWDFDCPLGNRAALPYPALRGQFQLGNASAVLAALAVLHDRLPVNMSAVRRGLVEVTLAGRFQVIPGKPALILDVAHNPHAARSFASNLAALLPAPRRYAVLGMLQDKDMAGVIAAVRAQFDVWLLATLDVPRGARAEQLVAALRAQGVTGEILTFPDPRTAYRHACHVAGEDDRIAVFGSFYTVAEVLQNLRSHG